ncbi:MAG: tetratricopeptide repeat protein [Acutalibacteraceae bacterium]|nr:tetratricopeptide repeat protein [Acutalibacteraceae bacterium]
MAYEELSIKGFIDEIKEVSSGPHPRKFCFVLGAGASRASGIKSGQELVDIWEKELLARNEEDYLKWKKEKGITEENKYSFYSQYYEKRFKRQPMDGYNYLEKLMEKAKPSIGYVMLAYLLSKKSDNVVSNNVAITTNFDHLIEDAVNYYTQTMPLVIGHEALAHYVTKQLNRPTILKIHRDLLFNPANTADEVEKLDDNWKEALNKIFSEYHPIFIGYAGNDNSVMDYLIENGEKFSKNDLCFPYWMLYKDEKLEGKVAEFLNHSSGYYIRHNGFDEVLCSLGAEFGIKIPTKEKFLGDVEKRHQDLLDAMDEFSEKSIKESDVKKNNSNSENTVEDEEVVTQAVKQITSNSKLNSMYSEVVTLINEDKYDKAISRSRELIELSPDNARYHATLGVALAELKRYEEALKEFENAIELDSDEAIYYVMQGKALVNLEHYKDALSAIQTAVELDNDNANYHALLGSVLIELKRYEEALKGCQTSVELDNDNANYHALLGSVLIELKRYEEALKEYQTAVELDNDNARYHALLGGVLIELKCYEEALKEYQTAVELDNDNVHYYVMLSSVLTELKRYEEALLSAQKTVALEPDNADCYVILVDLLINLKRYEEALSAVQKLVELEPDDAYYHIMIGELLTRLERYDEAILAMQKAVDLEPDNEDYKRFLEDVKKLIEGNDK